MLLQIITENGVKKIKPLTADAGAGNPVGTIIVTYASQVPSNYLPLGTQFDATQYPLLYALLGTDTTPTASAMGLPTLSAGQYVIKATSGLSENAQDNVVAQLNEERSYSTSEVNTGKKWIDGKPIYRKVYTGNITSNNIVSVNISSLSIATIINGYGAVTNTDSNVVPFGYSNDVKWFYTKNSTLLNLQSNYTGEYYINIEYTKTTDV